MNRQKFADQYACAIDHMMAQKAVKLDLSEDFFLAWRWVWDRPSVDDLSQVLVGEFPRPSHDHGVMWRHGFLVLTRTEINALERHGAIRVPMLPPSFPPQRFEEALVAAHQEVGVRLRPV